MPSLWGEGGNKKRGVLERSGEPWGEGGGAKICACTYAFARALALPTSSGMRWGEGGGSEA